MFLVGQGGVVPLPHLLFHIAGTNFLDCSDHFLSVGFRSVFSSHFDSTQKSFCHNHGAESNPTGKEQFSSVFFVLFIWLVVAVLRLLRFSGLLLLDEENIDEDHKAKSMQPNQRRQEQKQGQVQRQVQAARRVTTAVAVTVTIASTFDLDGH